MNGLTKKLQAMKAQLEGHDWRGPVGRAMQNVVRSHYIGRGGVFWPRMGKAFARADTDNSVRMKVEGQEAAILQHKIHGGTIRAKTGRMLAIPANPDAKSKGSPSTFSTPALQLAVFGGHAALVEKVGGGRKQRAGQHVNLGGVQRTARGWKQVQERFRVWYWLKAAVTQQADPNALPPHGMVESVCLDAMKKWAARFASGSQT